MSSSICIYFYGRSKIWEKSSHGFCETVLILFRFYYTWNPIPFYSLFLASCLNSKRKHYLGWAARPWLCYRRQLALLSCEGFVNYVQLYKKSSTRLYRLWQWVLRLRPTDRHRKKYTKCYTELENESTCYSRVRLSFCILYRKDNNIYVYSL